MRFSQIKEKSLCVKDFSPNYQINCALSVNEDLSDGDKRKHGNKKERC